MKFVDSDQVRHYTSKLPLKYLEASQREKRESFLNFLQDNDTHESAAALESKKIVSSAVVQAGSTLFPFAYR